MPRVLVTPTILRNVPGLYCDTLLQGGFEVVYPPDGCDTMQRENLLPLLAGADAMLASTERLSREVLSGSKLRVVARMGVGYDSVDVPAATDLGIAVTITPGTLEESVAEHTVALLLGVTRGLVQRDREVRAGHWTRLPMPRVAGRTFGIVGLGRIGRAVVPKVQGLGMRVVAFDPFADRDLASRLGVTLMSLSELLQTADVVSLHTTTTADTVNLISRQTLSQMKPGSILINTGRGALIDEDALCEALDRGHLFGAALDVFKIEPLPVSSRLLNYPNVLLCTHMGGLDWDSQTAASNLAAQCIVDLYRGRWPEACVINRELRDRYRW
jgi:D-3-phosphoglycerate dehydrogenase/(S)-sulfolactate dehydrogenase